MPVAGSGPARVRAACRAVGRSRGHLQRSVPVPFELTSSAVELLSARAASLPIGVAHCRCAPSRCPRPRRTSPASPARPPRPRLPGGGAPRRCGRGRRRTSPSSRPRCRRGRRQRPLRVAGRATEDHDTGALDHGPDRDEPERAIPQRGPPARPTGDHQPVTAMAVATTPSSDRLSTTVKARVSPRSRESQPAGPAQAGEHQAAGQRGDHPTAGASSARARARRRPSRATHDRRRWPGPMASPSVTACQRPSGSTR